MTSNAVIDAAALYRGPLNDFIARRDAVAKQLRASGDRAGADATRAMRKPSRIAWALNAASESDLYATLIECAHATIAAQSGGGDVRGAMTRLRESVRAFAASAAANATGKVPGIDKTALVNATFAVLGDAESLELLREGRLVDIPAAGGLDFLATMTAAPVLTVTTARTTGEVGGEALMRAEEQLADLRTTVDHALRELNKADAEVDLAERRLQDASKILAAARSRRDETAAAVESANARMREAEDKLLQLKRGLAID